MAGRKQLPDIMAEALGLIRPAPEGTRLTVVRKPGRAGRLLRPAVDQPEARTGSPLEGYLKKLKLPTMLKEFNSVAVVCQEDNCDFPTYLTRLAERELVERKKRVTERRIKEASLPELKRIETFDFKAQPSLDEATVRELLRGEYIGRKENILLIGDSGTGKTHLACALALAACGQGRKVLFRPVTGLVTELLECRDQRRLHHLQTRLEKIHLLVLDELGYVPLSKAGAELLFEVISGAYERQSLIVTTNLPLEKWTEVLGSVKLSRALLDRLCHRCHILTTQGQSYRQRQAPPELRGWLRDRQIGQDQLRH